MPSFEINKVLIAHDNPETLNILNGLAGQGWEPYAITGVAHYFKREKLPAAINLPAGADASKMSRDELLQSSKDGQSKGNAKQGKRK